MDLAGRSLPHKTITLLNIYAPDQPNVDFYAHITDFLLQRDSPNRVMGDFNAVVSPMVDRSACGDTDAPPNATLQRLTEQFSLCDQWRAVNPASREYTYYSVHDSFSCIDYGLVSSSLYSMIKESISPIVISDHTPISLLLGVLPK